MCACTAAEPCDNHFELSCIMPSIGKPHLVPLKKTSLESLVTDYIIPLNDARSEEQSTTKIKKLLPTILRALWQEIVSPITDVLISIGTPHGSRIWWCPSSVFTILLSS